MQGGYGGNGGYGFNQGYGQGWQQQGYGQGGYGYDQQAMYQQWQLQQQQYMAQMQGYQQQQQQQGGQDDAPQQSGGLTSSGAQRYVPPGARGGDKASGKAGGKSKGGGGGFNNPDERSSKASGGGGGKGNKKESSEMTLEEYQADKARKAAERKEKMAKQQEEARAAARARMEAQERGEVPDAEPAPAPAPAPAKVEAQPEPKEAEKAPPAPAPAPAAEEPEEDWEAHAAEEKPAPAPEPAPAPKPEPVKEVAKAPEPAKPAPVPEPAAAEEEEEEEEVAVKKGDDKASELKLPDPRPHLNVVFIGHVDAGKSTTCGNILYLCDMVDERTVEKYKKEATDKAGESWFLAYIMDTGEEEKAKGKTVEVGRAFFNTTNRRFTILDAPGHKSYVPNMIAGASAADVGVLLVSARKGEFETGFEKGGQTCEHAILAKTLGVEKLIIAINKMDDITVEWAQSRYDEIVKKISVFLKKSGYKDDQVAFLPISGLMGDNIKERKKTPAWFTGTTLLETLDKIDVSGRKGDAPLRVPMMEGYKDMGAVTGLGKVEQGTIKPGMKCIIVPTNQKVTVNAVCLNDEEYQYATCGENVTFRLTGVNEDELKKGYVLCALKDPVPAITKFKAVIHLIELSAERPVLTCGYRAIMHAHLCNEECEIKKLYETMPIATKKKEKNPKFARIDSVVTCSIELARPTALETFASLQQLGRFTLRDEGRTIAIGKITELPKSTGEEKKK